MLVAAVLSPLPLAKRRASLSRFLNRAQNHLYSRVFMVTEDTIEGGVSLHNEGTPSLNESGTTAMPDSGFPRDEPLTLEVLSRQYGVLFALVESSKTQYTLDQQRTDRRLEQLEERYRHLEEATAAKMDTLTASVNEGRAENRLMQANLGTVAVESGNTSIICREIKTTMDTQNRIEDRNRQANHAYVPQILVAVIALLGALGGVWLGHIWK